MTASLETLVVAAYVFACSLRIPRPGPAGKVSDQELIALAVARAITGLCSDRQFLGAIGRLLPGFFPELPTQTRYNRRLRRLTPGITTVQPMVAEPIAEGQVRLVDGTLIACANYPGCQSHSHFAGHASYGYCATMRLRNVEAIAILSAEPGLRESTELNPPGTKRPSRNAATSRPERYSKEWTNGRCPLGK